MTILFWAIAAILCAGSVLLILPPATSETATSETATSETATTNDTCHQEDEQEQEQEQKQVQNQRQNKSHIQSLMIMAAVPLFALGLYLPFGSPNLSSTPYATRDFVAEARMHLRQRDIATALNTYALAATKAPHDINLRLEAIEAAAPFLDKLPPAGMARFVTLAEEALAQDPENPRSLYFAGLASTTKGDAKTARRLWLKLARKMEPGTVHHKQIMHEINALAE